MARGVNKVILIGNLGQDPETRYTPNGLAVTKLSLATTDRRKDDQGEWVDQTDWHRVVLFGKLAEVASQYCVKGAQVYIEGRVSYGSYTDKEGIKRYTTDIIASQMQLLGRRDDAGRGDDPFYNQTSTKPPEGDDSSFSPFDDKDDVDEEQAPF